MSLTVKQSHVVVKRKSYTTNHLQLSRIAGSSSCVKPQEWVRAILLTKMREYWLDVNMRVRRLPTPVEMQTRKITRDGARGV
jgi:hypothetical protein